VTETNVNTVINELISSSQFQYVYAEKQEKLLPILQYQTELCIQQIPAFKQYVREMNFSCEDVLDYYDLPFLPVSMFKQFKLCTAPDNQIVRTLESSATTTGIPSRIYLDKTTSFRQIRGLTAIMTDVLGKQRRPFLILDHPEVIQPAASLSARGAAIRGLEQFASSKIFALKNAAMGAGMLPDIDAMEEFFNTHSGKSVLLFGFTFIVWMYVVEALSKRGVRFKHSQLTLLHSGGWKQLSNMQVSKSVFAAGVAEVFGCEPGVVRDFYGMVEQGGVVFVDCEAGHKHSPNFAEIAIRDFISLRPVAVGGSGLIQVMSALPASYPGQALLTEDVGTLLGYDDCPCGRKGMYFRFRSRVERAEVRGCGDTFAVSRYVKPESPMNVMPKIVSEQARSKIDMIVAPAGLSAIPEGAALFDVLRNNWTLNVEERAHLPINIIVALLDAAAQQMYSEEFRGIAGIAFLAGWLRRHNLEKILRLNLGAEIAALDGMVDIDGIGLRAAPRGVVAHWVAGNIPTLAFFSWALATLAKNASIIRISGASREPTQALFGAVRRAEVVVDGRRYSGELLLKHSCVLYFPSEDDDLHRAMSMTADARVVWGGAEAVDEISRLPRLQHCEDVVFGPKFSLAVIDAATLKDDILRGRALRELAREVVLFEQRACSSPQIVYVEGDPERLHNFLPLLGELAAEFTALGRRFPKQAIAETATANIVRARAEYGLRPDAIVCASHDMSFTILLDATPNHVEALQDRTLFVKIVSDVTQIVPVLNPKIQSIGLGIADQIKRMQFTEAAALRGVARCVPLGKMNLYETPWDGMKPISRLVRWCRV
jgi:phenylacetate-coenzyme A ligase PaaK-like adenylate-forming protein